MGVRIQEDINGRLDDLKFRSFGHHYSVWSACYNLAAHGCLEGPLAEKEAGTRKKAKDDARQSIRDDQQTRKVSITAHLA